MAKLIYAAITSLDGYIEDSEGKFDWAAPDEAVHAFVNDLERPVGTYLYGRRMFETMQAWEHAERFVDERPVMQDFAAIWQRAEKIVYSRTLDRVSSARTRIERSFDADAVRRMKEAATSEISVGGAELASHAFALGLVDECRLFLNPIAVGGGKRALPTHFRLELTLVSEHRFANGVVYLRYRVGR